MATLKTAAALNRTEYTHVWHLNSICSLSMRLFGKVCAIEFAIDATRKQYTRTFGDALLTVGIQWLINKSGSGQHEQQNFAVKVCCIYTINNGQRHPSSLRIKYITHHSISYT